MAYDQIEPPDLWQSATARLLYRLVCSWSSGRPPSFSDFFPAQPVEPMDEAAILAAFGLSG